MKYNEEIINRICGYIEQGDSNKTAAAKAGLSEDQFYEWKKNKPEFAERVKMAQAAYNEWYNNGILIDAKKSLRRLITGEEVEEIKTELQQDPANPDAPKIKKQTRTKKIILPNPTAVIFALVNRDPEHWQNRINTEVKADVKTDDAKLDLSKIPNELLEEAMKYVGEAK